jgi:hypothetical protein
MSHGTAAGCINNNFSNPKQLMFGSLAGLSRSALVLLRPTQNRPEQTQVTPEAAEHMMHKLHRSFRSFLHAFPSHLVCDIAAAELGSAEAFQTCRVQHKIVHRETR